MKFTYSFEARMNDSMEMHPCFLTPLSPPSEIEEFCDWLSHSACDGFVDGARHSTVWVPQSTYAKGHHRLRL